MPEILTSTELNSIMSYELMEDDQNATEAYLIDESMIGHIALQKQVKANFDLTA